VNTIISKPGLTTVPSPAGNAIVSIFQGCEGCKIAISPLIEDSLCSGPDGGKYNSLNCYVPQKSSDQSVSFTNHPLNRGPTRYVISSQHDDHYVIVKVRLIGESPGIWQVSPGSWLNSNLSIYSILQQLIIVK